MKKKLLIIFSAPSIVMLPMINIARVQSVIPQSTPVLPYTSYYATNDTSSATPMFTLVFIVICALIFMGLLFFMCIRLYFVLRRPDIEAQPIERSPRVIFNRSLDWGMIETFPTFTYSDVKGLKIGKGALECAVCITEYNDYETLRWLTKCDHVFHSDCIDAWLSSHVTCPVCRADLSVPDNDEVSICVNVVQQVVVQPGENVERFTLTLPAGIRKEITSRAALNPSTSLLILPRETSSRKGYRAGGLDGSSSSTLV